MKISVVIPCYNEETTIQEILKLVQIALNKKEYEIILVDEDGHLAEGPTANLFLVNQAGELPTPPARKVLHGVTRSSIIEIAKAEGIPLREAELLPIELIEASEAFLTGTTAGVWPVESVDRRALSNCPGAISMKLQGRFKKVARGDDPEFSHWLTPAAD